MPSSILLKSISVQVTTLLKQRRSEEFKLDIIAVYSIAVSLLLRLKCPAINVSALIDKLPNKTNNTEKIIIKNNNIQTIDIFLENDKNVVIQKNILRVINENWKT